MLCGRFQTFRQTFHRPDKELLLSSPVIKPVKQFGTLKLVSDDEINEVLTKVLGDNWENYLYEYKRNLGKYNGMAEQHIAKS